MQYAFDTEHGLRLAYAGVMPGLISEELAVRVVHPEAKSWDMRPFYAEMARYVDLFTPALTRRERFNLARTRALRPLGWYRFRTLARRAKSRLTGRDETEAGGIKRIHA
jgi:hypothetical protein